MDGRNKPAAVVLLSGGIDSAVAAAMFREQFRLVKLTVEYGQPTAEKVAAIAIADWLGIAERDRILCRIPSFTASREPSHYFPVRNLVFLSLAAHEAERMGAATIIVGANADDQADYPDCRPEFFTEFTKAVTLGSFTKFNIRTPLIDLTKAEIVKEALNLGVPLAKTLSCYRPRDRTPCGTCNACLLRQKAFEANGLDFRREPLPIDLTQWGRE